MRVCVHACVCLRARLFECVCVCVCVRLRVRVGACAYVCVRAACAREVSRDSRSLDDTRFAVLKDLEDTIVDASSVQLSLQIFRWLRDVLKCLLAEGAPMTAD